MSLKRVQMNLEESLVKRIDEYAEKHHITRTSAVSVLCSQVLDSVENMNSLKKLFDSVSNEK